MTNAAVAVNPVGQVAPTSVNYSLRRGKIGLALVGLMFLIVQLVIVPHPFGLSPDEANYLAKVDPSVPELYWSQPRAWGMPVLAAPVAVFSAGLLVIRTYFGFLSSGLLVAAFWPWLRILHPAVAPVAALLFSTTWMTVAYGSLVMPNLYLSVGAVAVAGLFLRAVQDTTWWRIASVGAVATFITIVRPTDSVLVLAPLFACALAVSRLRRLKVLVAIAVGSAIGWLPWIIEAYIRFGGPLSRLHGGETAGPGGLNLRASNLLIYPRLLDGTPTFCCTGGTPTDAGPVPLVLTGWLVAFLLTVSLGVVCAKRQGRLVEIMLVGLPALLLAGFYLLLPRFTTLRFLLPVFALLSLPVAVALIHLILMRSGGWRKVAAGVVVAALSAHVGFMLVKAERQLDKRAKVLASQFQIADAVGPLVEGRPCLLVAPAPHAVALHLGCDAQIAGMSKRPPTRVVRAQANGQLIVAVVRSPPSPDSYMASWRAVPVRGLPSRFEAYMPPG